MDVERILQLAYCVICHEGSTADSRVRAVPPEGWVRWDVPVHEAIQVQAGKVAFEEVFACSLGRFI